MSYEKRRKYRARRKFLREILILFIVGYFIVRAIPGFIGIGIKTIYPEEDLVIDEVATEGIVIKKEDVYKVESEIKEDSKYGEGEKVPVGFVVTNLFTNEESERNREALEKVKEAQKFKSLSPEDLELLEEKNKKIRYEQEAIAETIQENIKEYGKIKELKRVAIENNKNYVEFDTNNEYLNYTPEELVVKEQELSEKLKNTELNHSIQNSGLLTYNLDGYEGKYSSLEFDNYKYNIFQSKEEGKIENLNGFKVIDNFYWYIAIKIENFKLLGELEENSLMEVSIDDNERFLLGKIMKINRTGNKGVVIVRFNNYLEEYYSKRFPIVKVIKSKETGLKIPSRTIIEQDGIKGVFIKEFNGIIRFRPIKVLKEKNDFTYVSKGRDGYIELKNSDELKKTITLYDEIVLTPTNHFDGEIID